MKYHEPVLLQESVDALITDAGGIYVDATFGGGGHSKEIMKQLTNGKLIAFDQDEDAVQNVNNDKRFMLIRSNFRYIKKFLKYHNMMPINGVIADLGISSHQVDTAERGFSTRFEATLDMRMNAKSEITAEKIINEYPEEKLREIFVEYGELRQAKLITRKIITERSAKKIVSTKELIGILKNEAERGNEQQFFSKIFQALRIEVNQELEGLKEMLMQCADVIVSGGRLVVISYHSLEDRLVKNFIATGNFSNETERDVLYGNVKGKLFTAVNKKPIEPTKDEIANNPRSRSARMRIAERN